MHIKYTVYFGEYSLVVLENTQGVHIPSRDIENIVRKRRIDTAKTVWFEYNPELKLKEQYPGNWFLLSVDAEDNYMVYGTSISKFEVEAFISKCEELEEARTVKSKFEGFLIID